MRVMEVVRLATDRYAEGPTGRVIAVGTPGSGQVTVSWDGGKTTTHPRSELVLVSSPYRRAQVSE